MENLLKLKPLKNIKNEKKRKLKNDKDFQYEI